MPCLTLWMLTALAAPTLPAAIELEPAATEAVRGGPVEVRASFPEGVATAYLVLSDQAQDPICPAVLEGACLDVTGGWVVLGPMPVADRAATWVTVLPDTFTGALLQGQVVARGKTGLVVSDIAAWSVPGTARPGAGSAKPEFREALLSGLAPE